MCNQGIPLFADCCILCHHEGIRIGAFFSPLPLRVSSPPTRLVITAAATSWSGGGGGSLPAAVEYGNWNTIRERGGGCTNAVRRALLINAASISGRCCWAETHFSHSNRLQSAAGVPLTRINSVQGVLNAWDGSYKRQFDMLVSQVVGQQIG